MHFTGVKLPYPSQEKFLGCPQRICREELSKTARSRALYNWALSQDSDNHDKQPTHGDPRFAAALEALSKEQKNFLKYFAWLKMWPLTSTVRHSDAEDLLQEAITKSLNGERKWNPDVNPKVVKHLIECMSSIANNWYKTANKRAELNSSDLAS